MAYAQLGSVTDEGWVSQFKMALKSQVEKEEIVTHRRRDECCMCLV